MCVDYEKHLHPCLLDKVCHLQHISYKGTRYKRLKDEGVFIVKDFLTLLYTDPKRLQDVATYFSYLSITVDIDLYLLFQLQGYTYIIHFLKRT